MHGLLLESSGETGSEGVEVRPGLLTDPLQLLV